MLSFSSLHRHSPKLSSAPPLPPLLPPPQPNSLHLSHATSSPATLRTRSLSPTATVTTPITQILNPAETMDPTQIFPFSDHTLKIAILGFGNFGQFIAKTLVSQGHTVLAYSQTDHSNDAKSLNVAYFHDPHDLCEQHPEVILICTSIISTEEVLRSIPFQRLKRNTLFVDVLSVKEFSKVLLLDILPEHFDIICAHPMFGPQSAKEGWNDLYFVYENVRIGSDESRASRCRKFLDVFAREGCKMVEMCCLEHDKHAAGSQFITHTVGRVLEMMNLESTPINTKGYESLLELVENTQGDSFDLYYGLFMYNKNALEMLERLDLAFDALRKQLFGRLHEVVRKQLFGKGERGLHLNRNSYVNGHYLNGSFVNGHHLNGSYVNGNGNSAALPSNSESERSQGSAQSYEYKISSSVGDCSKLKIAILGFGNFGQFLAKTLVRQGHTVLAYSRRDYSDVAKKLGVSYFSDADDLCEEHPEVILLCTSILSTEDVLKSLPFQRLKRSTLFVDVLSVKEFPRNLFLKHLPPDFDILCTHPMFGPESGKNGWNRLRFVFDKVRIGNDEAKISRCNRFLDIFAREGCIMVEMSCAEHDRHAAGSQFITHTIGRVLEKLDLQSTPINTKGYETLLKLVENTAGDSFDLYYGLFMYNANSMEQLERLDWAFESLKKQLFGRLHGVIRKQLFEDADKFQVSRDLKEEPSLAEVSKNISAMTSSFEFLNFHNN